MGNPSAAAAAAAMEHLPSPPLPPPVFIDTNLDTHLAMILSPEDTVADLKRKVSLEHVICFPNIGHVTVRSMKVRRKGMYYHLSDSMLVRTAFDGIKGTWFLHTDVAPVDSDVNAAGGESNRTKWGVNGGPSSVNVPVKADSNMKLNHTSPPSCSVIPSVSGQEQFPRLELPSNDVLLCSEQHGEVSKDKLRKVKPSHISGNSAPELGGRSQVDNSESHKLLLKTNEVSSSDFQLATDTNHLNKNVNAKDFADAVDTIDDGNASTVAAEMKKSRKRSMKLEDGRLLRPPSEKKRHKKEEEKKNASSCKDHGKDLLEVIVTGNVQKENISMDHIAGSNSLLGDVHGQLPKDDSILRGELPHEKQKRKKKRRKEYDECHSEMDTGECLNATDRQKNSDLGTGLSEHTSDEKDLVLGDKTIDNQEKIFVTSDDNQGPNSTMELPNKKNAEASINENHVEMDSGVHPKGNKRSSRQRKKEVTKGELPDSQLSNSETIHPTSQCFNASNRQKKEAPGTGLSACTPSENDLVSGSKTVDNKEKISPISDDNQGSNSAMELLNEKAAEASINENHVEMDSGVLAKESKKSSRQKKKKVTKGELPGPELGKTEIIHPVGKQNNGENSEEVPAHDPKHVATEINEEIVSNKASRLGNVAEIVPEALPNDVKISSSSKKRSRKTGSSKIKSSKDGAFGSATNIEETVVVSGNFIEADTSIPNTNKSLTREKKKSIKTKESSAEAPREADPPIPGPPTLTEQSSVVKHAEASNEKATLGAASVPEATHQGLLNTDGGRIAKNSRGRKVQQSDIVNHGLGELPNDLSTKQKNKSHKQKAADKPQAVQNEGRGNSDLCHADTSPHMQSPKSSQDHQIAEHHNEDIFTGNRLKKPTHHAEEKVSVDLLGANPHSVQQKTGGNSGNFMKQMNANPAASDDSTEEDTPFNEKLYRIAVREKVSNHGSKKDLNKSSQEVFRYAAGNIFGDSTSTSSEDEVEGNNGNDANKTVSDNLASDDSEEDLEQTQVIIGPKAQKNAGSRGVSPSSPHILHKKEASDDDILLPQTSNAAKKRISLGVLLRGSHSYRKAKRTAQSQTDDTENQHVDVVPETQPDFS